VVKITLLTKYTTYISIIYPMPNIYVLKFHVSVLQGCWAEVQSDEEQQRMAKTNVMLLYDCGVFGAFVDLLNIEIE
jgi:hypothetical protein